MYISLKNEGFSLKNTASASGKPLCLYKKDLQGWELWHSELSCSVHVPYRSAPLLARPPGQQVMAHVLGPLLHTWETNEFLAIGFDVTQPGCGGHLESEPADGRSVCVLPSL